MKKRIISIVLALVLVVSLAACSSGGGGTTTAATQATGGGEATTAAGGSESTPITIKLSGAFAESSDHYFYFEQFCQSVSEKSNGSVTVVWGNGPEAIPADQLGEAMQNGIVELVYIPVAYLVGFVPGLRGLKLTDPVQMRQNGGVEYVDSIIQEVLNCHYLARTQNGSEFAIGVNKEITSLDDFKGLTIRSASATQPVVEAVGAEMVTMGWGDVYSAIEKNVIDGVGGSYKDFVDNSLGGMMKYLIQPGVFTSDSSLFISNGVWDKLDESQRQAIVDAAIEWEEAALEYNLANNQKDIEALEAAGTTVIEFEGDLREEFLTAVYDQAWKEAEEGDPEVAAKLRSFTEN